MADTLFPYPPAAPLALVIDLEALAHNYRSLCSELKNGALCAASIKANAYGMGLKEVAMRLYQEGCRHFFIAYLPEAVELQYFVGKDSFIYVLSGFRPGDEAIYAEYNVIPVLGDLDQVQAWNAFGHSKQQCLRAALHFDTGLNRTGLPMQTVRKLELSLFSHTEIICVISHLACSYQPDHPLNEIQRLAFEELRHRFPFAIGSLANSGGIFLDGSYHYDMVRPGLSLSGCPTSVPCNEYKLKPVLKAYAQILQINQIQRGESVGYDTTFIVRRPSRIATLGVGYGDGYFRNLSNCGELYFKGYRVPVVGRVSMDLLTVDVTDLPPYLVACGDWMELFGDNIQADEVAKKAGTVSYELFTRLGPRFERFYVSTKTRMPENAYASTNLGEKN